MNTRTVFTIFACIVSLALNATTARAQPNATDRIMETSSISPEGCTIEKFRVLSPAMGLEIRAVVVPPPEYKDHPEKRYPILYTFHGADAPCDCFSQMIPLRQALKDKPMIVSCMDGDARSWYIDAHSPAGVRLQPHRRPTARVRCIERVR